MSEGVIKKHVAIIHAYSQMSVIQRKIFNVLLHKINEAVRVPKDEDSVSIECRIPLIDVSNCIKFNSNNKQYLKEAIDGLASLKIEWNLLRDKVPQGISFLNLRILHGSPTFYHDGTLNFSIHKVLLDLACNPSVYGTIELGVQADFESKYSHSMYENCTRFVNLQKNKTIPIDIFRKIIGVAEDKYLTTKELKRSIISPSIEEVNDRAPFIIKINEFKVGKQIMGFEIEAQSKQKIAYFPRNESTNENHSLINEITKDFGNINAVVLQNILNNYSREHILANLDYTKKYAKKESSGLYPIRYFISAIKNNYSMSTKASSHTDHITKTDPCIEWEKELEWLKKDQAHWLRMLQQAQMDNDLTRIETIRQVLLTCENKIRKHGTLTPIPEENVK